ncbi:hypothetical protein [Nocardioides sp. Soil777]|uniref:hypothetical protein n=1 Tax=Nocardioides sp. Soil777 TaxID=1736409 RepID=UPI0012FC6962|nr:hypothetical protein [Nocardioides sp. Soil777]
MDSEVDSEVVVVAPRDVDAGFRLAGAATVVPEPGPDGEMEDGMDGEVGADAVNRAVETAVRLPGDGRAVVLVHHDAWTRLPVAARDAWAERTDVLVVGLPPDAPAVDTEPHDQLQRLLGRAVGYEISFVPEGDHP